MTSLKDNRSELSDDLPEDFGGDPIRDWTPVLGRFVISFEYRAPV